MTVPRRLRAAAVRAYIDGHDRVRVRESKLGLDGSEADPVIEFGAAPARPRYGVAVPARLRFHRGPSDWRDRAREPESPADG